MAWTAAVKRFFMPRRSRREEGLIPLAEDGFWKVRHPPHASLKTAARLFDQIDGRTIVEIGTGLHGPQSGDSVLVWAAKTSAQAIYALDLDPDRVAEVQAAVAPYPQVHAEVRDGIEFLAAYAGSVELLYLDFWVSDQAGEIPGTGRAQAYLRAYQAARDKLSPSSLILIDDTDHADPWKQTHIVPAARADGFTVLYQGRQTLLLRLAGA
jgi:predicted O-methyltransferase YrrM